MKLSVKTTTTQPEAMAISSRWKRNDVLCRFHIFGVLSLKREAK